MMQINRLLAVATFDQFRNSLLVFGLAMALHHKELANVALAFQGERFGPRGSLPGPRYACGDV